MSATVIQLLQQPDYLAEIARGVAALRQGKLIVLPTESAYGVAGLVSLPAGREAFNELRAGTRGPLTLHLAEAETAINLLGNPSGFARKMMRKLWPGPVGLIFDVPHAQRDIAAKAVGVKPSLLFHDSQITLRCPNHPVFHDVVSRVAGYVALTTAGSAARNADDLAKTVGDRVELIFDAGEARLAKPSTLVKVLANGYQIVREGVYDQRIIDRLLKTTILFVCSGNTCRSPMAEAIARMILAKDHGLPPEELENAGITVLSAGSYAAAGNKATAEAIQVGQQMGFDLSRHRSRPLSVELINQADHIYTMTRAHAAAVAATAPAAGDKISPLDPTQDIEDPIGGDVSLYKEVAEQMRRLIETRVRKDLM